MGAGDRWTEDEVTVACYLYLYSDRVTADDRRVLADMFGRTEKSIGAKLDNIARFDGDPRRAVWTHGSKVDGEVWEKFMSEPMKMASRAMDILRSYDGKGGEIIAEKIPIEGFCDIENLDMGPGIEREAIVKVRVNQGSFRRGVLREYGYRCCLTGVSDTGLLVASHIKPWAQCNPSERLRVDNGLCLNAMHDKLFDRAMMTVDPDLRVIYAPSLEKEVDSTYYEESIARYGRFIGRARPDPEFLEYHNRLFEKRNGVKVTDL